MAASATFALKVAVWFRRGRLFMVSPDSLGTACPLSGRNSTYRSVQISETSSYVLFPLLTIVGALCGPAFGQRAYPNVPTGIFGEKDQRVRISSDRWPWVAIGRINVIAGTGPQLCTGTVIGSRRVLTAAQCLFDALINNWVKPSSVHFVVGQEKDKNLGHSVVESFVKSPDFAYRLEERPRWDAIDPKMIRRNWAILSLRDELPVKTN